MRSFVSFIALLSIFVSGILPGYAQIVRRPAGKSVQPLDEREILSPSADRTFPLISRRPPGKGRTVTPDAGETRFSAADAFTEGQGVWIRWRMHTERRNAGFRVYRYTKAGLIPVSNPIPGSLFTYGDQVANNTEYSYFDRKGSADHSYVVESLSEGAEATRTERVIPRLVADLGSVKGGDQLRIETQGMKPGENLVGSDLNVSPELQAEIAIGQIQPNPSKHVEVISQPGVRIASKGHGVVRVFKAQLESAGFDVDSDPTNWQLYLQGVELPIIIGPNADYIEFLGKGLDTLESDLRTYYLINAATAGRRIPLQTVRRPITSVVSRKFDQTFTREDRKTYTNVILNGAEENWWGDFVLQNAANVPSNHTFVLAGVDRTPGTRRLKISFQGFSLTPHIIDLTLNGHAVGTANGSGRLPFNGEFDVPVDWLLDGINTLALRASGGTVPPTPNPIADLVFIDKLSIDFPRDYVATGSPQVESFNASSNPQLPVLPGTVTLTFTSANLATSPITVEVELAGGENTSSQAALYRAALSANPAINARYAISGTGSAVVITDRLKAADDPTLSVSLADTDNTRINPIANSSNTSKGIENRLDFYTENYKNATVSGFSSPNFRVFDLTYENHPRLLTNLQAVQKNGTWGPVIPAARERVLYAVDEGLYDVAISVTANDPELLQVPSNAGTMLLISHPNFVPQAEIWAAYRSAQGISTKVIDVNEIYDEFNYGVLSSHAIESFLNYAKNNWQTPPSYVMLFGEAHYDSRNYAGAGYWNMVPSRLVDTLFSETGSDEALSDFDNDGLAEIPIGRASSRDAAGVTALFNKTVAWETLLTENPLDRGVVFAYDRPNGYDFKAMSTRVQDKLPVEVPRLNIAEAICTDDSNVDTCTTNANGNTEIRDAINSTGGTYILNYTGHGSAAFWSRQSFFSSNDAALLTNSDTPMLISALTCLNGYFMGNVNTFAETMTNASNGGAVAVWASTGLTTPDVQEIMAARFYLKLGEGNITRMGDLIADAKSQVPFGADVRLSWALLGDPMLRVR